jgi:hypothetical protein
MAGWDRKANWNHDVLEHIVALLFAFAGIADLAAGLPAFRRRHVLGILSCGEAEARAFVVGVVFDAPTAADAPEQAGDAARLAASFRALALALCAMVALARQSALPGATGVQADRRKTAEQAGRQAPPAAPDTS